MKAIQVLRENVETVRKSLMDDGYLDTERKIINRGAIFEIPVIDEALPKLSLFSVIEQEHVEYYEPAPTLKNLMMQHLDDGKLDLLPGGWQILGDIIIISLSKHMYPLRIQVGEALLKLYPGCKSVFLDEGIQGELRRPRRELIAVREGVHDPGTTIHIENGCKFRLDVTRIMFSKGNLNERIRMSRLGGGENVVDMFSGIGYFSIPMAVHSRPDKIRAIELNPESYDYLRENILLNNVEEIVCPVLGDCAKKTPISEAHRVIMGYVGRTHQFLKYGIRALKQGGMLHYHDTLPIKLIPFGLKEMIESEARTQGREAEIIDWRRIKKYSPGVWHIVVDVRIT